MSDRDPVPLRFSFWRAGVMLVICSDLVLVATVFGRIRLGRSSSKLCIEQASAAFLGIQQKMPSLKPSEGGGDEAIIVNSPSDHVRFASSRSFASSPVPRDSITYMTLPVTRTAFLR